MSSLSFLFFHCNTQPLYQLHSTPTILLCRNTIFLSSKISWCLHCNWGIIFGLPKTLHRDLNLATLCHSSVAFYVPRSCCFFHTFKSVWCGWCLHGQVPACSSRCSLGPLDQSYSNFRVLIPRKHVLIVSMSKRCWFLE